MSAHSSLAISQNSKMALVKGARRAPSVELEKKLKVNSTNYPPTCERAKLSEPPVGLERDAIEAGDLAQVSLELVEEDAVAARLLDRRERVHVGELREAARQHLGGTVQLHRARALSSHHDHIVIVTRGPHFL